MESISLLPIYLSTHHFKDGCIRAHEKAQLLKNFLIQPLFKILYSRNWDFWNKAIKPWSTGETLISFLKMPLSCGHCNFSKGCSVLKGRWWWPLTFDLAGEGFPFEFIQYCFKLVEVWINIHPIFAFSVPLKYNFKPDSILVFRMSCDVWFSVW